MRTSQMPAPVRSTPEWRQPAAPEMGRVEAPSTQPYSPPDTMEDIPELLQPERMHTEETIQPRIRRDRPEQAR